jgi:hypothetical protein
MRIRKLSVVPLCFAGLLLVSFAAAAAQNVTTIVHDYDSAGNQLLLRSDDYNGSGQATYTAFSSRKSSLSSFITSTGELELLLNNQSLRTIWVTPNDPVGSQPAGPPAGYFWNGTTVRSDCFDQNSNVVPLANIVTSSGNCKLGVNFNSGGTLYKLLMSPFPFSGSGDGTPTCPQTGCPPTGLALVTCNSLSNGQCVSWTIVPNTDAPNPNVANLYWYYSRGPNSTWVYIGQYHNTFRIDVTNP